MPRIAKTKADAAHVPFWDRDHAFATRTEVGVAIQTLMAFAAMRRGPELAAALQAEMLTGVAEGAFQIGQSGDRLGVGADEAKGWLWVSAAAGHLEASRRIDAAKPTPHSLTPAPAQSDAAREGYVSLEQSVADELGDADILAHAPPNKAPRESKESREARDADGANGLPDDMLAEFSAGPLPGKVIIWGIGDPESKEGKDLSRRYAPVVNQHLVYSGMRKEPGEVRDAVIARWPWAVAAAEQIENHLAVLRMSRKSDLHLQPLLFVGDPGCGKTSIAEFVCKMLSLYTNVVPCGGSSDAVGLTAVSRGWSTARPSAIASSVLEHRVANPAFVLDEIDKTVRVGSQNGSVQGALLSMISSRAYFDNCLMSKIDTTSMIFIATANSLKTIDDALLDRFQIIRFDTPGLDHFDTLMANVRADFAESYGLAEWEIPEPDHQGRAVLKRWLETRRSARSFRQAFDVLVKGMIRENEGKARVLN